MRAGIILQARMGSTRLPGKVLMPLAGKPMILRIIDRLKLMKNIDQLIVAVPNLEEDNKLCNLLENENVQIFRGNSEDVLDRYYQCAKVNNLQLIVRATGDNPFVDPSAGEDLLVFMKDGNYDYTCSFPEFGSYFPLGVGLEIFTFESLYKSWSFGKKSHHREHVNEYIHENRNLFKFGVFKGKIPNNLSSYRLTVDTAMDYAYANYLFSNFISL